MRVIQQRSRSMKKTLIFLLLFVIISTYISNEVYAESFDERGFDKNTGKIKEGGTLPPDYNGNFECLGTCSVDVLFITGSGSKNKGVISFTDGSLQKGAITTTGSFNYDIDSDSFDIKQAELNDVPITNANNVKTTAVGFEGIANVGTTVNHVIIKPKGTRFVYPPKEAENGVQIIAGEFAETTVDSTDISIYGGSADVNPYEAKLILVGGEHAGRINFERHGIPLVVHPSGSTTEIDLSDDRRTRITTGSGRVGIDDGERHYNFEARGTDGFRNNKLSIGASVLEGRNSILTEGGWDWIVADKNNLYSIEGLTGAIYNNKPYDGKIEFSPDKDLLELHGHNTFGRIDNEGGGFFTTEGGIGSTKPEGNIFFSYPPSQSLKYTLLENPELREKTYGIFSYHGILNEHKLKKFEDALNPRGYPFDTLKDTADDEHTSFVSTHGDNHHSTATKEARIFFDPSRLGLEHEDIKTIALGLPLQEGTEPTISTVAGYEGPGFLEGVRLDFVRPMPRSLEDMLKFKEAELELGLPNTEFRFNLDLEKLGEGEVTAERGGFGVTTSFGLDEFFTRYSITGVNEKILEKLPQRLREALRGAETTVTFGFGGEHGHEGTEAKHKGGEEGLHDNEKKLRKEYFGGFYVTIPFK